MDLDRVFINLAIVKTNWDEDQSSILDNFMPIIGHAIQQLPEEEVSELELKQKVAEISGFRIPGGALSVLIRRAAKKKYNYVVRNQGLFLKNSAKLSKIDFESKRHLARKEIHNIRTKFSLYCREELDTTDNNISFLDGFADVLPDIAASLLRSLNTNYNFSSKAYEDNTLHYYVCSFIVNVQQHDKEIFQQIVNISKGAIIAELLYYTDETMIKKKMKDVKIYFDTTLLLYILGYAEEYEVSSSAELVDMLNNMSGKLRIFSNTLSELQGIFSAASSTARRGWTGTQRPGDAFDILYRRGCSSSDIELIKSTLEKELSSRNIFIEDPPIINNSTHIDVNKLNSYIDELIPNQTEKSRDHDVRVLTAVNQLRSGSPKNFLESCNAIFVTTNVLLTRAASRFFSEEIGKSDAPVCMPNHVFTMLMWLKTVSKKPDLPAEILLANAMAALDPSVILWDKYISEAIRLKNTGKISEEDYHFLSRALEAKSVLMVLTHGDENYIIEGAVKDVLRKSKDVFIKNVEKKYSNSNIRREKFLRP